MSGAVVMLVDDVEKVNKAMETGIVINDAFVSVSPLTAPTKRVTLSNVPPFISDEVLLRELARHGKIVSSVRKLPSGCKSPLLRHVVSHRRQVQMILNKKEELSLVFNLRVDDFEYVVFVTSGTLKCFGCGREGHLVRACPEKSSSVRKAQSEETQSQTEQDAEETTETQQSQENTETEREAAVSQKEDGRKNDSEAGEQTTALDTAEKTVKDTDRLTTEGHLMGGKDLFKPPSLRGNSRPSAVSLRLRKEQLIRAEAGSRSRTSQKLSPAWRRRTRRRRRKAHDEDSQSQTDSQPSVKTQQGQSYEDTKSMRDLEIEIVELQRSAESTGTRGCFEDLKSLLGSKAKGGVGPT
ncbi:hypothetical protein L3Q82_010082, partial [Scortum barcoo]